MKRYIISDLKRLEKRVPRWVLVGLTVIIATAIIAAMCATSDTPTTGGDYAAMAKSAVALCAVLFGLYEIEFIYGDDFKAKTMQIAIGSGISRRRIVNSKWVITMIVVAFDILFLNIALIIAGFFASVGFSFRDMMGMLLYGASEWLFVTATVGVVAILIFAAQKTGLGVLLYLAIQFGAIGKIVELLSSVAHIEKYHIQSYELASLCEVFAARLELGSIHITSFIGILIYMGASFLLAYTVFKHRELEF